MRRAECPKCKAALPPTGQFCLDCGLDLYAEGVHHRPVPWFKIIAIPVVVAAVLAALIIGPPKRETAPEVEAVLAQTRDLLGLLAQKDYATAVERYFKTNAARFDAAEETLRETARGQGAQGFKNAQSQAFRSLDDALAYVRKYGTRNPDYIGKLLHVMVTHAEPNPWRSSRRTEMFFAWYLEQAFGGADVAQAQLDSGDARWEGGLLTVKVRYPELAAPPPGVADPRVLRWRLVRSGWAGCERQRVVLDFCTSDDDHLAELLDLFKRLTAE